MTWPLDIQDGDVLCCPECGNCCTHINVVHVGTRTSEGAAPFRVTVHATGVVDEQPAYEPLSDARQWVELVIDCENGCTGTLVLSQHKGHTQVSYRSTVQREPYGAEGMPLSVANKIADDLAAERVARSIARHLRSGEAACSDARRALPSRDRPHFDAAVERLVAARQVVRFGTEHGERLRLTEEATR